MSVQFVQKLSSALTP